MASYSGIGANRNKLHLYFTRGRITILPFFCPQGEFPWHDSYCLDRMPAPFQLPGAEPARAQLQGHRTGHAEMGHLKELMQSGKV